MDKFTKPLANATRGLSKFDQKLADSQSRAFKAGQQIGTGIKNTAKLIAAATIAVGVAGTGLLIASLKSASDLGETVSKVGVVFKAQAARILAFGKTSSAALGLSENAALSAAATYGNLFVSMGLAEDKSADMSLRLVQLASDLASFNNIDPTEALDKLRAGLTGESEPLKTLGININETIIKAKALELGLVGNATAIVKSAASVAELKLQHIALNEATKEVSTATKQYGADSVQALEATVKREKAEAKLEGTVKKVPVVLTAAQKAQAAYALIVEQSTTAQGDFGRTQTGLANQTRILRANWENLKATLATPVLPKVAKIFERINAAVVANQPGVAKLGDNIAALFSDKNIAEGTRQLKSLFQTAKDVAPALQSAAEVTGRVVKTAVDLFRSLPPDLQKLLVVAAAANKLTGGLVTNLAGGLISAVLSSFKGLMTVNAGVVNVLGGAGIPGAAAAGGAGLISTVAGMAVPVVVLAVGAKAAADLANAEFADKGIKTNFVAPEAGIGGIIPGLQNIAEIFRIWQSGERPPSWTKVLQDSARKFDEAAKANRRHDTGGGVNGLIQGNIEALRANTVAVRMSAEQARSIYAKSATARGIKDDLTTGSTSITSRLKFIGGGKSAGDRLAVANALVTHIERSNKPLYESSKSQARTLKTLTSAQVAFTRAGDTKSARTIGGYIDRLRRKISGKDPVTKVDVSVKSSPIYINGRLFQASVTRHSSVVGHSITGGGSGSNAW